MKSMTGYGYSETDNGDFILTLEIKAYNNRFLDISFNAPPLLSCFEQDVCNRIKSVVARGHLDVGFRLRTLRQDCEINVDDRTASAYALAAGKVSEICAAQGLAVKVLLSDILDKEGVLTSIRHEEGSTYSNAVAECLDQALDMLEKGRVREGKATRSNLGSLIGGISKSLDIVESRALELEQGIKTGLKAKMDEMLHNAQYDENRILSEVAVMLMRYTINEEISRLRTHIDEFHRLLDQDGPVGKRMDFLCQEMNREINTIGSKSQIVRINLAVVDMKDCLENIREQVRNVE